MSATNVLDSYSQHGFMDRLPKGTFHFSNTIVSSHNSYNSSSGIASNALEQATSLSGRYYHNVYSNETAARLGIGRFVGELVETAQSALTSVRALLNLCLGTTLFEL